MLDILLSQPGTCVFPVFVLLMLAWALWTRRSHPLNYGEASSIVLDGWSDRYRSNLGHGLVERRALWPAVIGSLPSPLRGLHASCAADYHAIFERMKDQIKRA
jgi:hypothetical protein